VTPPVLRDYQAQLLDDAREAFRAHRRVLAVLPTGGGKTVSFADLTRRVAERGKRVVITAHRIEIVQQISGALTAMGVPHGMIAAGHPRNGQPVQVGMVQTLARRTQHLDVPDLLVIDEAHHAVAGTWATLAAAWPRARILGVTATPERQDGKGLRAAFDAMVIGPSVRDLIERGHLAPFRHWSTPEAFDTSGIRTTAGDYNAADVAAAMVKQRIVGCAVTEYRQRADGLPAVAFCPTVAFAEQVAADFRAAGIPAAAVDGGMAPHARAAALDGLRRGTIRVITSCDLISEGFDVPAIGAAILLRPTKSLGLYMQQVGRVLRPKPDGSHAVIIDHVGNGIAHGLADAPREWSLDGKAARRETPPVRQCPACYRVFAAGEAPDCTTAPCGLAPDTASGSSERKAPEVIAGELVDLTETVRVGWAPGTDLRASPLRDVLRHARTREQLAAVAAARGYSPGWVHHVMRTRERRTA
jgi:superfamily II DNA or RNA helicase